MKKIIFSAVVSAMFATPILAQPAHISNQPERVVSQVDFSQVKINDTFWSPRLDRHASATLPVCIDQIENQTGRMRNFINAANKTGQHSGIFFDDSDVYKAMEGMAYSLINHPDAALESKLDQWVANIAAAQQEDGYINTYFTLTTEERWKDMDKHEMYCAGHLIEAGVAYLKATGKRTLLDVGQRMADHMMTLFGPEKRHWVAGHEEIELALVKLYEVTGEQKYIDFAYWLLEERGHGYGTNGKNNNWNKTYYQDLVPVKDLRKIGGHAVRAMYLFCGMADVASYRDDTDYMTALDALWHNTVDRNMYITGGIGSSASNEGFTYDYDLPNASAYCETCASVGMVLWNHRMNLLTGNGKYVDVMERSMYNGLLAGINLNGDRFFYVNPLESAGNHHRQAWFGTACCPSNVSRFLPSIGSYIYATNDDALWVNLYIGNEATFKLGNETVNVTMETQYPWEGLVNITLDKAASKQVRLRIPDWCRSYSVKLDGNTVETSLENGYAIVNTADKNGKVSIELSLDMPIETVEADPHVIEDLGCRAIQRGPLVYCAEGVDNRQAIFDAFRITPETTFSEEQSSILGGIRLITAKTQNLSLKLIPYYAWDNRTAGKMLVWLKNEDYDDYHKEVALAPSFVTRDWGYQYGNIVPIDMRNDGKKELLIGAWFKYGSETPRYSLILEPNGDGTWKETTSPFNIADRPSFSPCDINGDGILDLIMFEQTGNSSDGIYLGKGDGTFTRLRYRFVDAREGLPENYTAPITNIVNIMSADVADFNNDGLMDIVGIGHESSPTVVLLNQGISGNFINLKPIYFDSGITNPELDIADGKPYASRNFTCGMVYAQDFNNDGYADILISSNNWNRQNYDADWERYTEVYLNNGKGTGFERTYFARSLGQENDELQNPSVSDGGVAIADFNGDGYLDIFLQGAGGYYTYYYDHSFVVINDGTGHFAPLPPEEFDRLDIRNYNSVSGGAQAYDWNGDGLIDIIYSGICHSLNSQAGFIWLNNTGGAGQTFKRAIRWAGGEESASCLVDWNGDGLKDLVNTGHTDDATFLSGNNTGRTMRVTFSEERETPQPNKPLSINATVEGNQVTLEWTPADGAPKSTTYELYIKNEEGMLLGSPRAYVDGEMEGLRKCEEYGKLGCVTAITYTLPDGSYEWGVQAVDGRRVGSKFAKGTFAVGSSGISEQPVGQPSQEQAYYMTDGRKLNHRPDRKGIYLHQGRKVVIE
ncbi:MAG: glycoside hydrolase family 127 protein [Prevotella sp.]|nr:glycoside hydrolase family 127 protein [Prevotella sp.]